MAHQRRFRAGLFAFVLLSVAPTRTAEAQAERPNLIVILADDMGFSDVGAYGSEIETPHLDGLAREGLRFTQFYATPRCSPTRAALLTGLYPHQVGMGHLSGGFGDPAYQGYLNERSLTLAEALKPAGYRSYAVGKWHVGDARERWPLRHGFDRFYGIPVGGGVYFWPPHLGRTLVLDTTAVTPPEGWYSTDAFSDYAVRFVEEHAAEHAGRPFFLYLAHIAPHFPLQAPPEAVAEYEGRYLAGWDTLRARRLERQQTSGLLASDVALPPRTSRAPAWASLTDAERAAQAHKMAVYAAQVDRMDQGIGRLVDALDRLGLAENTLVVFLSDNGASAERIDRSRDPDAPVGHPDSFVSYGPGWANLSDAPFQRFKKWTYEGGIRSPLLARWPGEIGAGTTTAAVGHVIDLMPTFLELAGAAYPGEAAGLLPLEGKSLVPVLRGADIRGQIGRCSGSTRGTERCGRAGGSWWPNRARRGRSTTWRRTRSSCMI